MVSSLFVSGVILGVFLVPIRSDDQVTVCVEEDEDLRVDCHIQPKPGQFNSYEFSWSYGSKETLINTNFSGSAAERRFLGRSYVEELEPTGYRLTLTGFTHTLPQSTTFMCKISKTVASVDIEKEHLLPCAAISIFSQSCSWILCILLFFCHTNSWGLEPY